MALVPLAEAISYVVDNCSPLDPVSLGLDDALGCVLAQDVVATEAVPPWANSAMDGYGVVSADVVSASPQSPVTLEVVDTVLAGHPGEVAMGSGQAVRIMTGAPIPPGADCVVIVEKTVGSPDSSHVEVLAGVEVGANIREAGSDIAPGEVVCHESTLLRPMHLGVLASVGVRKPMLRRRPVVGVISTGDELIDDDRPLAPGQIRESNRPMLVALARYYGFDAVDLGTVPDDEQAISAALVDAAKRCDAVVTSGGVSMGDVDLVRVVLDSLADMRWMKLAIRPAKPFAFGVLGETPVFGLPGNPVSAMVSFSLLAVPGLRRLAGRQDLALPRLKAVAGQDISRRTDGRVAYIRACAEWNDGRLVATPVSRQGYYQLASSSAADVLVEVPDGDGVSEGDELTAILLGFAR